MKKILIIDDEPDIIEILNYNLTKENYKVKAFENPLEAINYLKFNKTDLIISCSKKCMSNPTRSNKRCAEELT